MDSRARVMQRVLSVLMTAILMVGFVPTDAVALMLEGEDQQVELIEDGRIVAGLNGGGPEFDVTDDGGIVYANNGAYVMAIMSSVPANHGALHTLTATIDAAHDEM